MSNDPHAEKVLRDYYATQIRQWIIDVCVPWAKQVHDALLSVKITSAGPSLSGKKTSVRFRLGGKTRSFTGNAAPSFYEVLETCSSPDSISDEYYRAKQTWENHNPDNLEKPWKIFQDAHILVSNEIPENEYQVTDFELQILLSLQNGIGKMITKLTTEAKPVFDAVVQMDYSSKVAAWNRSVGKKNLLAALRTAFIEYGVNEDDLSQLLKQVQVESVLKG